MDDELRVEVSYVCAFYRYKMSGHDAGTAWAQAKIAIFSLLQGNGHDLYPAMGLSLIHI